MAKKPTLYLDTSVFSALYYRGASFPATARRMTTEEWWDTERKHFDLFTSSSVEIELERGTYRGKARALKEAKRVKYLPHTTSENQIVKELLLEEIVPRNKPGDALQLGSALAHRMDYLLTWNYAHLANHEVAKRLDVLGVKKKWRAPWMVSPDTIPWVGLGNDVRRKD